MSDQQPENVPTPEEIEQCAEEGLCLKCTQQMQARDGQEATQYCDQCAQEELIAAQAKITELERLEKNYCEDWEDNDTDIKAVCVRFGIDTVGDSYCVPPMGDCVEKLGEITDQLKARVKELEDSIVNFKIETISAAKNFEHLASKLGFKRADNNYQACMILWEWFEGHRSPIKDDDLIDRNERLEKIAKSWQDAAMHGLENEKLLVGQNQRLREALSIMINSANPNPTEHPTMFAAWSKGKEALSPATQGEETK